jgi:RNA polymerase sigma factor (sigma-70 family)
VSEAGVDNVAGLFLEYRPSLMRWAEAATRSDADAEDAVQDAMLAVLRAPHLLAVVERTGSWLYALVRRRCIDILRREGVRRSNEYEAALQDLFEDAADALGQMERLEFVTAVADAANRLDPPIRFAFVENALEGKTFAELSAQSGIPMGTLMARKQKAVELLKQELRGRGLLPAGAPTDRR